MLSDSFELAPFDDIRGRVWEGLSMQRVLGLISGAGDGLPLSLSLSVVCDSEL